MEPKGYDLYLSYSARGAGAAATLHDRLRSLGLSCRRRADDQVIDDHWERATSAALQAARNVAVCIGRGGPDRPQQREIAIALEAAPADRPRLTRILLPGAAGAMDFLPDELADALRGSRALDLSEGFDDERIRAFARLILLSRTGGGSVPSAHSRPLDPGEEARLAYLRTLDGRIAPEQLLHGDRQELKRALGLSDRIDAEELRSEIALLSVRYGDPEPSALWLRWLMRSMAGQG
jgi:hypothetical protein